MQEFFLIVDEPNKKKRLHTQILIYKKKKQIFTNIKLKIRYSIMKKKMVILTSHLAVPVFLVRLADTH